MKIHDGGVNDDESVCSYILMPGHQLLFIQIERSFCDFIARNLDLHSLDRAIKDKC